MSLTIGLAIYWFLILGMRRGDCRRTITMNIATLLYAKSIRDSFRVERHRAKHPTTKPVAKPLKAKPLMAKGRPLGRGEPTTFHRCLAIHMHFAEHAGALD